MKIKKCAVCGIKTFYKLCPKHRKAVEKAFRDVLKYARSSALCIVKSEYKNQLYSK